MLLARVASPLVLGVVLVHAGCSSERSPEPEAVPPTIDSGRADPGPPPSSSESSSAPDGTATRLEHTVAALADDALSGRATPSPGLDRAARSIADRFRELGLQSPPGIEGHEQRFECGGPQAPGEAANVWALLRGRDPKRRDEFVMITAHYDHLGSEPDGASDDPVFNGANDNASGVAAMLELARLLAADPPSRSILFGAFCGEERGLLGSRYYVAHPIVPLEDTVAQFNLEMLGRPGDDPGRVWMTGMERSNLGSMLARGLAAHGSGVDVVSAKEIGRVEGGAFDRSDNYPLALAGVVAHSVSTGRLGPLYHTVQDEASTLDYENMARLVEALARGIADVANADERPVWSDAPRPPRTRRRNR